MSSRFRSIERNCTAMQFIGDNGTVEWNESFEHVCFLTILKGNVFHQWDVGFEVINVLENEPNTRLSVVGTAFLNIAEFVSPGKNTGQTTKIPFSCCIGGATTEAALVVSLSHFISNPRDLSSLEISEVYFMLNFHFQKIIKK